MTRDLLVVSSSISFSPCESCPRPSATELLFAIGPRRRGFIAVTPRVGIHARRRSSPARPEPTCSSRDSVARQIDAAVRERTERGEDDLHTRRGAPGRDRAGSIGTQALWKSARCPTKTVVAMRNAWEEPPRVISLDRHTIGEVLGTVRTLADADRPPRRGPFALVHGRYRPGSTAGASSGERGAAPPRRRSSGWTRCSRGTDPAAAHRVSRRRECFGIPGEALAHGGRGRRSRQRRPEGVVVRCSAATTRAGAGGCCEGHRASSRRLGRPRGRGRGRESEYFSRPGRGSWTASS